MKKIAYNNITVILYIILAIFIEFAGSFITDERFYVRDLRYLLTLILFFSSIFLLVKNQKVRLALISIVLICQTLINVGFIMLYDMAEQYFDFSMLSLRSDAMGILESIPVNYWFFTGTAIILSLFIVYSRKLVRRIEKSELSKKRNLIRNLVLVFLMFLSVVLNFVTALSINSVEKDSYMDLLKGSASSQYNQYGITSNFINEVYAGTVLSSDETMRRDEISEFIYGNGIKETTDYFGVSKDNNVVVILGETFEWFSFINNQEVYPNGQNLSEDEIAYLFPNFTKYFTDNENTVSMTEYHAREKTDISEMYSILGSYPTGEYINYDYDSNTFAQSMPNVVRAMTDGGYQTNYFHNGYQSFYNREVVMPNIGFDNAYFTEQMVASSVLDDEYVDGMIYDVFEDWGADGERNLDSQMIEACKDLMFPTNGDRFYTQIATISSHGKFSYRENLEQGGYYTKLLNCGIDVQDEDLSDHEYQFYNYMAASMELDTAVGMIFEELETRGLLEDTTVLMYGDHNAYYDGLSYYVKGIEDEEQAEADGLNYLELFRVPALIYDEKLASAIDANGGSKTIDKFAGPQDLVPTLMDLLGIVAYDNLYYGSSFFAKEVNILYSRAYGVFISEYAYFKNLNTIYFVEEEKRDIFDEYLVELTTMGERLIEKIRYNDQAFQADFFASETYYNDFYYRLSSMSKQALSFN